MRSGFVLEPLSAITTQGVDGRVLSLEFCWDNGSWVLLVTVSERLKILVSAVRFCPWPHLLFFFLASLTVLFTAKVLCFLTPRLGS